MELLIKLMEIVNKIINIFSKPGVQKYTKNTLWLFFEQFVRLSINFFVGVWVARYLGPEKYGLFNYALAYVAIFQGLAKLGLDGIVIRDILNYPEKEVDYLTTAFWLKVAGGLLALIVIISSIFISTNDFDTRLFVIIISFGIIFQCSEIVDFYFQSKVLAKYISISKLIQLVLSSALKLYFIYKKADLIYFVIIFLIDQIILSALYFAAYYKYSGKINFLNVKKINIHLALALLKESYPMMLVLISATIYARINQIMIKNYLGDYELGIFSVAVRICEILTVASPIFAYSFYPALINANKNSHELFKDRIIKLYSFVLWMSLFLCLIVMLLSDKIILFLFGTKYIPAGDVIKVYIFTVICSYIGGISSRWYLINNLQRYFMYFLILSAIFNIIMNMIMIPRYSLVGASLSSVITYIFSSYISNILTKRTYYNFILQTRAIIYPFNIALKYVKVLIM
ncbi:MAG: flippase [Verrucomicrobiia bacterium]